MTFPPGPPPGWYLDPASRSGLRWWDGHGWTEHARPGPPVNVREPDDVAGLIAGEQRSSPWAQRALVAYFLAAIGSVLTDYSTESRLRRFVDRYRQVTDNLGTPGYVAPHPPELTSPWLGLGGLITIPCVVLLSGGAIVALAYERTLGDALVAIITQACMIVVMVPFIRAVGDDNRTAPMATW